jgi:hypothetical protein
VDALAQVYGVGPMKLEKYGTDFLQIMKEMK